MSFVVYFPIQINRSNRLCLKCNIRPINANSNCCVICSPRQCKNCQNRLLVSEDKFCSRECDRQYHRNRARYNQFNQFNQISRPDQFNQFNQFNHNSRPEQFNQSQFNRLSQPWQF